MNQLTALIHSELKKKGSLSFAEFMQLALYHPKFGYYNAGLPKFGREGDFITAPELTPLFGKAIAHTCQDILTALQHPVLFEFGAGSGRLCIDILKQLEISGTLPESYFILEVSGNLRERQQTLVQKEIPELAKRVHWLSEWPATPFSGVIIANEVLDAMPVNRFLQTKETLYESFIGLNEKDELVETYEPGVNPRLTDYLKNRLPDIVPYQSEVNLFIDGWLKQCSDMLDKGAMILVDYGFPNHEYYHPDRQQGTLMCHYRHLAHTNPLSYIGEQDITAHVNFTHVAEAAEASGFQVDGYTSQAAFLLASNLLSFLQEIDDPMEQIRATQAIKTLTHPSEMGELFKVMALSKNLERPLESFLSYDKRASL